MSKDHGFENDEDDYLNVNEDVLMKEEIESPASPPLEELQLIKEAITPILIKTSPSTNKRSASELEEEESRYLRSRATDPSWDEERKHYQKILATFRQYGGHTTKKLQKSLKYLKSLSKSHRDLLAEYKAHLKQIQICIDENQQLFHLMIMEESRLFENQEEVYPQNNKIMKKSQPEPTEYDFDKIQAVLKQIVRDWSSDGERERELCYKPIIDEVELIYSSTKNEEGLSEIKILVPGAGLGRLAHDLVRNGYAVEGNEFSLFMLFASNYILNKCTGINQYRCYPWIHQTTNVLNQSDQIRPAVFPDVDPFDIPLNSKFSMTAGDFLDVYGTPSQKGAWDCVTTCFFIDCAHNVIEFLERILYCLKDGGIWINLGPLLYHYAEMPEDHSIEPPFNILVEIIKKIGFNIKKQLTNVPTSYADNTKSMLSYTYNSVYLVCEKTKSQERSSTIDDTDSTGDFS